MHSISHLFHPHCLGAGGCIWVCHFIVRHFLWNGLFKAGSNCTASQTSFVCLVLDKGIVLVRALHCWACPMELEAQRSLYGI